MLIHFLFKKHGSLSRRPIQASPRSLLSLFVIAFSIHSIHIAPATRSTFIERELQFRATVLSVSKGCTDAGGIACGRARIVKVLEFGLVGGVFAEFGQGCGLGNHGQSNAEKSWGAGRAYLNRIGIAIDLTTVLVVRPSILT